MKNWWIKFGCILTGYNYNIVKNSSEISVKAVKRYTAAILIVCILWAFIGYSFTNRYLRGSEIMSSIGACIFVIIIIQIERQLILSINPSKWLIIARGIIACMMAIIGSIIIDQIIFKEDIELEKITFIEERVRKAIEPKTKDLRDQIEQINKAISEKEAERLVLIENITKNPNMTVFSTQAITTNTKSSEENPETGKPVTVEKTTPVIVTTRSNIPNPKIQMIPAIEKTISDLRTQKTEKETALINIRPKLEKDISSKVGFLDELKVMYSILSQSMIALVIWLIWFFFLLGLEMLVLISKKSEKENDYERTVQHHMDLQFKKLELFAKMGEFK
ncbi:DUF4407 domain-containing protein [Flavobacterium soyae]|uniref:DUF4407 domain-containing protein n=1 Tax=Flavobacterium soyae TaxID=2903098 RepID=UPI001E556969|nr:DUF4407 domain-containing protein [Flavobacterium soyae]MCD9574453.1 DUF4407 domain-containing protein [Flavobacterium soyae]